MNDRIMRTDKARDQLYAIIQYIAEDSGNVDIALSYLDTLEGEINKLSSAPHMGSYPRYATLRKQDYRVLIVKRHLVFYKVNDDKHEVMIYAVVDTKQHYVNLI